MKSDDVADVAIVGGGASGTILAAQLARRGIRTLLIDGSGRMGRGVAYSTMEPAHLLNVRAEGMSAWAGEPSHFAERFEREGGDRKGFAERRLFGRYLGEILEQAVATGSLTCVAEQAVGAERSAGAWRLGLDDGSERLARGLVLAIGNQEPERLRAFDGAGARFVANPWGADAQAAISDLVDSGKDVLLIGTGLTMVDVVLSLHARGYQGRISALSRRGLVPRAHADAQPAPAALDEIPLGNLRTLTRWLRRRSGEVGWRAAVDGLRPHSHALWQSFDDVQQRRFLRHARPWWDVHRHRIAPEVARTIAGMIAGDQLQVSAAKISQVAARADGLEVTVRRRGADRNEIFSVAYAFNCTGPLHSIRRSNDPLLKALLDAGQIAADPLGIGIAVDGRSRASGGERLWAMGPLTKGRYWEIVAVPDIREQAAAVADDIEQELGSE